MSTPVRQLATRGCSSSWRPIRARRRRSQAWNGAGEPFSETPNIQKVDVLAAKLPVPDMD
jgi:hypothetical protein